MIRLADCVIDEADEASDDDDSEDEDDRAAPRTVWAWGDSFAVYQSQRKLSLIHI